MQITNKVYHDFSLDFSHQRNLLDLPKEILLLIIIHYHGLSKFVMHFVSRNFWNWTIYNEQNCKSCVSFTMYVIDNTWLYNKMNKKGSKYGRIIINRLCELAAEDGSLSIVKWLRENKFEWNKSTCEAAAVNGHIKVLKWARKNGCEWDEKTCSYAALNGHFEVLKWAR